MIVISVKISTSKLIYTIMRCVALLLWAMHDSILGIIYCTNCQKFYLAVNEAEMACMLLLKKNCTKSQEQLFKNIVHMCGEFSQMSACGLFNVNAALPLSLMGCIGYYSIVLLQFYVY
ncbi:uncharacterized protein LOC124641551 [Helicoverpa zea]|uniref:uncharacterized protein LOC124641551 n=1 Tax=Helicoverpa zea TaxID=7113 RepID=UPI001F596C29|nr:uncharacterized protein LOC124641551 [Helicoverpa zea]